jgi:hypothetical protein
MNTYIQLMQQAEQTNSRREAIKLINQATEYLSTQAYKPINHGNRDLEAYPKLS